MYVIKAQQNSDVYEQRSIAESPFVACVSPPVGVYHTTASAVEVSEVSDDILSTISHHGGGPG